MLSELPLEIIRRICTNLSPESALCFAHSCQHTYRAFDDWAVWRAVVKGNARVPTESPTIKLAIHRGESSKKMAGASVALHGDGLCKSPDIEKYMPQLLVLGCKCDGCPGLTRKLIKYVDTMAAPPDLATIYDQCRALVSRQEYPPSLVRAKTDSSKWFEFMTDPISRFEHKEWLSVQTASLCFAIGALTDIGHVYESEEPFARLEDVQWFNSTASQRDCSDSLVMQHALANAAIGSFCLELRTALHGERTIGEDFEGTSNPPTISNIPLASQLASCLPSSPESLKDSSPNCLMAAVNPDYFTHHAWTGYVSTRGDWRSVYHGIGCHNLRDLPSMDKLNQIHSNGTAVTIDQTVQFQIVETLANGDFILRSNYFHTRDDMYTLSILVEKRTGRLSVCMAGPGDAAPMSLQAKPRNGLNTPFGIVYGIEPGSWLWLWRAEWSADKTGRRRL